MSWASAVKKPWSGAPAGTYGGQGTAGAAGKVRARPLSPFVPLPPALDEDSRLLEAYAIALRDLAADDPKFDKNYKVFSRWDNERRLKWIYTVEAQAREGLDTIGVHVVTRVVANRLE